MRFEHIPVIDTMIDLYQKPRDMARFKDYLQTLTGGNNNNLELPIMGFNPMAKEHILDKLLTLKALNADKIIEETLEQINKNIKELNGETFKVVLNVPDDLKGGWTDFYTSDYGCKFKIKNFAKRNFCIPLFWSSEEFSQESIKQIITEFCYRTVYFMQNPINETLEHHVNQEIFVAQNTKSSTSISKIEFQHLNIFYSTHKKSTHFPLILNFFYSDSASEKLGYPLLGIKTKMAGFEFAKALAKL
jgi:hypothetical protein